MAVGCKSEGELVKSPGEWWLRPPVVEQCSHKATGSKAAREPRAKMVDVFMQGTCGFHESVSVSLLRFALVLSLPSFFPYSPPFLSLSFHLASLLSYLFFPPSLMTPRLLVSIPCSLVVA